MGEKIYGVECEELVEGMGFGALYEPGFSLYKSGASLVSRLKGVSAPRAQKRALLQTAGLAALAAGATFALRALGGDHPR
jgi:hypothetical protein